MTDHTLLSRRHAIAGMTTLLAVGSVQGQEQDATASGLVSDSEADQSQALQAALDRAAATGDVLRLPRGVIYAQGLMLPGNITIEGVPGSTSILPFSGGPIMSASERSSIILRDIIFAGRGSAEETPQLLSFEYADEILLERCSFQGAPAVAVNIFDAAVTIRDCRFSASGDAAIHSSDSRGLLVTGNRIDGCGNAGIRIWREQSGPDRSIVHANHIANIDWRGGGNGQNGNGINLFNADEVIVTDNHIADCAFTAVRLNSTNNTQVSGNTCLRSGEVAIFSEFAFSGSVIANNIVDGAAAGISITNFDTGGQLAVCSGNIVRNIAPKSAVNPDTTPVGIFAEADTAITGNTVQGVPGVGIAAGYGTFLRNVLISGNVVSESDIGIGVSVVDGAGTVHVGGNIVSARQHATVGLAWTDVVEPDLQANAGRFANVQIGD